jgi:phosphatidylglycerol:prolipoprotein diacylglycerol transferase
MAPRLIDDFVVWATIGIVGGGRVGYVLVYDLPRFLDNPGSIFALWEGGMSFHGGLAGTTLAMILFSWRYRVSPWSLFDVIGPSVTFGLFLGRIANFINGELWGRVTDLPWGVVFCNEHILAAQGICPAGDLPRHPSQLYEAGLEGIGLFLLLRYFTHGQRRLRQPGFVGGAFTAFYGVGRTIAEFFRQPDIQIGFLSGGLTMGMALSIPLIVIGGAVMVWASRRPVAPEPAAGTGG